MCRMRGRYSLVRNWNGRHRLVGCVLMRIMFMLGGLGNCWNKSRRLGGSDGSWRGRVCEGWRMQRGRCMRWSMLMHLPRHGCMSRHVNQLWSGVWGDGRVQCGYRGLGKGRQRGRTRRRRSNVLFRSRRSLCRSTAHRCAAWRGGGVLRSGGGSGRHRRYPSGPGGDLEACAAACCACFNSFGSCRLILRNSLATPASR